MPARNLREMLLVLGARLAIAAALLGAAYLLAGCGSTSAEHFSQGETMTCLVARGDAAHIDDMPFVRGSEGNTQVDLGSMDAFLIFGADAGEAERAERAAEATAEAFGGSGDVARKSGNVAYYVNAPELDDATAEKVESCLR